MSYTFFLLRNFYLMTMTASLAFLVSSNGFAFKVYSGCSVPNSPVHTFYIDAVNGSPSGDGSKSHPWQSLQALFQSTSYSKPEWMPTACQGLLHPGSNCVSGPLFSNVPYGNYSSGNANAPVHPGDAVYLMTGNYGTLNISGIVNPDFLMIAAAPGETPVIGEMSIVNSAKFILQGIKFQSLRNGFAPLLLVSGNQGSPTSDLIINNNSFSSQDDVSSWTTQADWQKNVRQSGISLIANPVDTTNCVSVSNNRLFNLGLGMMVASSRTLVADNSINNFGDDGLDFAANNLLITHNLITNSNMIGDGNHNDGMQGLRGPPSYSNIVIDANTIIRQTDPALPFPGDFQGIDGFLNDWYNLTVTNNVVVLGGSANIPAGELANSSLGTLAQPCNALTSGKVCNGQGISFADVHGGLIANNTVLADNPAAPTWIKLNDNLDYTANGTTVNFHPADHVTIRNNISTQLFIYSPSPTIQYDHNLTNKMGWYDQASKSVIYSAGSASGESVIGNQNVVTSASLGALFQQYDPTNFVYNLNLVRGSQALGAGSNTDAPLLDIVGVRRNLSSVDLGAYAYISYEGSLQIEASARQIDNPSLVVFVDGSNVGFVHVTADIHTGEIGQYTVNFKSASAPKEISIRLYNYVPGVIPNTSVNIYHAYLLENTVLKKDLLANQILPGSFSGATKLNGKILELQSNGDSVNFSF